jgi:hypothetical protein
LSPTREPTAAAPMATGAAAPIERRPVTSPTAR